MSRARLDLSTARQKGCSCWSSGKLATCNNRFCVQSCVHVYTHLVMGRHEAPHLLGHVAHAELLVIENQAQPHTQLVVAVDNAEGVLIGQ